MISEDYNWHVNLVKDRYERYDLTFEQAEQIYRYERERDTNYTDKHIFSVWEEFEYELYEFRQILTSDQLKRYEADYENKLRLVEEGIAQTDSERLNEVRFAQERLDFYKNVFLPEFLESPLKLRLLFMQQEQSKVDFLKKE